MVFRLEETLESLLAEIEVEDIISGEVQWVSSWVEGIMGGKKVGSSIPPYLTSTWEAFKVRYRQELTAMHETAMHARKGMAGSEDMTWMVEIGWPLEEAIGNAAYHGNVDYGNKHIILTRHQGKNGIVYTVQDPGSGFDVQRVVRQLRNGEVYYGHKGVGLRIFEHSRMAVTFNDCGNQIIFQYLLSQSENCLPTSS